jgi:hypothetical protein
MLTKQVSGKTQMMLTMQFCYAKLLGGFKMILYVRQWLVRGKYIVFFLIFTSILYHLLLIVTQWIEPKERYQAPIGHSVKVFQSQASLSDQAPMGERLKLFYWLGE